MPELSNYNLDMLLARDSSLSIRIVLAHTNRKWILYGSGLSPLRLVQQSANTKSVCWLSKGSSLSGNDEWRVPIQWQL